MQNWDKYRRKTGLVIVLSGPSGVGKDRVLEEFVKVCPEAGRCVTYTTRLQRAGEVDGRDYHFVTADEFQQMVEAGQFLEYAQVHGKLYGTPLGWVKEQMAAGRDSILKIDVQGGIAAKKRIPEAVMVFLVPPSLQELEQRLRNRLTESEAQVAKRLQDACNELDQIPCYDYIIENDSLDDAVSRLRAIVIAERARIRPAS